VAVVMKRITSVSNRWLAERLQMGHPTSVAPFVYRFNQSGETDTPAFRAILSRFSISSRLIPEYDEPVYRAGQCLSAG
jgi:hypothetical protein